MFEFASKKKQKQNRSNWVEYIIRRTHENSILTPKIGYNSQITLSQICRTNYQGPFPYANEISEETCRAFDQWWNNQLAPQTSAATQKLLPFINAQKGNVDLQAAAADFQMLSSRNMHTSRESLLDNHKSSLHQPQHHHNNFIVHPALQTVHSQYSNQKTRMRTSFGEYIASMNYYLLQIEKINIWTLPKWTKIQNEFWTFFFAFFPISFSRPRNGIAQIATMVPGESASIATTNSIVCAAAEFIGFKTWPKAFGRQQCGVLV